MVNFHKVSAFSFIKKRLLPANKWNKPLVPEKNTVTKRE